MENFSVNSNLPINSSEADKSQVVDEQFTEAHDISLLEEKLVVKRLRRKAGEVIIRKKIETRTIHIPIRRETLIIEKAGIAAEHLAEIDLGEGEVNGVKFSELGDTNDIYQVQSEFVSPETLQKILNEVATCSNHHQVKLRLEIITDNSQAQQDYQNICTANCISDRS